MEVSAMLKSDGFNLWANAYDKSVNLSEEANEYPFAGYKDVLGTIYQIIKKGNGHGRKMMLLRQHLQKEKAMSVMMLLPLYWKVDLFTVTVKGQ